MRRELPVPAGDARGAPVARQLHRVRGQIRGLRQDLEGQPERGHGNRLVTIAAGVAAAAASAAAGAAASGGHPSRPVPAGPGRSGPVRRRCVTWRLPRPVFVR